VEDELHALMICEGHHDLTMLRSAWRNDTHHSLSSFEWETDKWSALLKVLREPRLAIWTAKYAYDVLMVFDTIPTFVPVPYIYQLVHLPPT
jgi:hypothetical protein